MGLSPFHRRPGAARASRIALAAWLGVSLALATPGCDRHPGADGEPSADVPVVKQNLESQHPPRTGGEPTANAGADTVWESCYVHGQKTGFNSTSTRPLTEGTQELVEIETDSLTSVLRLGDRNEINVHTTSVETPLGEVLRFSCTTRLGSDATTLRGSVADGELTLEVDKNGRVEEAKMPWPAGIKGLQGVELSLEREPMKKGETRAIKSLLPLLDQVVVADAVLTAQGIEETRLLEGSASLLRIDFQLMLPGAKGSGIRGAFWTDDAGRIIKRFVSGMDEETFRTTREQALEAPQGTPFDLLLETVVKVAKPLPPAGRIRRAVYRVALDGDDPAALFVETPYQQVKKLGPNSAEITVAAPRYDERPKAANPRDPPTADDSAPNKMIESDNPKIVALAQKAKGAAGDPLAVARALEKFVHQTVKAKNFSQVFATASQVADSHEGDCTEHAVFLAALARALGLPARVVVGLVYVPSQQGFAYHMWTEIHDGARWLPFDATAGQGGIGAGYLELGTSSLKDASGMTELISVVQVLGKLKIEVVEES